MKRSLTLWIAVLLAGLCTGQPGGDFLPVFRESKETTHNISAQQDYVFGYLEVLEDRSRPGGKTIQLPVYIFKSRDPDPRPDPVIYTVGGPGASTMPSAPYMNYYTYLDDRDLILFEQRGAPYARPHLDCPEWAEAVQLSNLQDGGPGRSDSLFVRAAEACRERLTGNGIDLNCYNTNAIAADIADLRKALGIDTYNLLTISYSTKIAQVLLRDYPEGIRSVVMDSPLPLEVRYDEESVGNLLEAVEKLLSDCASDADCSRAFPELKQRFFRYLREKTARPLELSVQNPNDGKTETFRLEGKDLIAVFTSASTGDVAGIPFEMNRLLNGDPGLVKEQLAYRFGEPGEGAGMGMRLSVWCAEEYPFAAQEKISEETTRYPELKGLSPAVFDASVCDAWRVAKVPGIEDQAVASDIPVLLISGEYDNETPPAWAVKMRENLTNSYHLVFKGWKHTPTTNWGDPCAMNAAKAFFDRPDAMPDPDCLEKIGTPKFRTE